VASEPVRTCVGCRERAAKRELVRVTVGSGADGQPVVVPDPRGTAPGRGAHLHPTTACYELAVRKKAFPRALRTQVQKGAGGLNSAAVGAYVAGREQENRDNRQEGWSSSS
jgi:predicted RNA-binding protein YlxR (DUF448 family)